METDMELLATVRASSWAKLFDCPLSWYYTNIEGIRSPSSGAAALGTAIHEGTALFDSATLNGDTVSVSDAAEASAEALKALEDVDWAGDDLSIGEALPIAARLTARYCLEVAPTRRYAAVELACDALDISTEYGVVRMTGTTDRIRLLPDGRAGISDLKSGKRATEKTEDGGRRAVTKGHHVQLGVYTLLAEQASGMALEAPAEIIGLQTTKEAPVALGEVPDVKTALLGYDDKPGLIVMAAKMLKEGFFPPNPKTMLCSPRYCAGYGKCKFKG